MRSVAVSGSDSRDAVVIARRRSAGPIVAWAFALLVVAYLFLPAAVVVLFSFTTSPRLSLPIEGLTLDWYAEALAEPLFAKALTNSLLLAAVTATVAIAIGVPFCFAIARLRARPRSVLLTASLAPAAVQQKYAPMSKILQSAYRVTTAGVLHPDSAPAAYEDSIKQWSIWTVEQNLNASRFADAFVAHTKKNVEAAGQKWSKDAEGLIRRAAPNRGRAAWRW